jgi:hypothetical protein
MHLSCNALGRPVTACAIPQTSYRSSSGDRRLPLQSPRPRCWKSKAPPTENGALQLTAIRMSMDRLPSSRLDNSHRATSFRQKQNPAEGLAGFCLIAFASTRRAGLPSNATSAAGVPGQRAGDVDVCPSDARQTGSCRFPNPLVLARSDTNPANSSAPFARITQFGFPLLQCELNTADPTSSSRIGISDLLVTFLTPALTNGVAHAAAIARLSAVVTLSWPWRRSAVVPCGVHVMIPGHGGKPDFRGMEPAFVSYVQSTGERRNSSLIEETPPC